MPLSRRNLLIATISMLPQWSRGATELPRRKVTMLLQESLDQFGKNISPVPEVRSILEFIEENCAFEFEYLVFPWQRALKECEAGTGLIFAISKSPERIRKFDFSKPLRSEGVWGIYLANRFTEIASAQDLKGKRVSIGRGFSHGMEFEALRSQQFFTIEEDPISRKSRLNKLAHGRADILLHQSARHRTREEVERSYLTERIPSFNDPFLLQQKFAVSQRPLFYDTVHIGCKKGMYQEELNRIDKLLSNIDMYPEFKKLLENYR